ncbi:helix-turn-helix transcriptional regulator [Nonomuraea sp. NPDC046802]|uniref:helix-turn-helix domain-containing protein n=1 Tax=Nonomuraea sp. NPDC046802 TaxID=3154919 RepID=UPI0033FB3B2F
MTERTDWADLRDRRLSEHGAAEAYETARLAFELGRAVRQMRESRGWSQSELARAADMTQSAVADPGDSERPRTRLGIGDDPLEIEPRAGGRRVRGTSAPLTFTLAECATAGLTGVVSGYK